MKFSIFFVPTAIFPRFTAVRAPKIPIKNSTSSNLAHHTKTTLNMDIVAPPRQSSNSTVKITGERNSVCFPPSIKKSALRTSRTRLLSTNLQTSDATSMLTASRTSPNKTSEMSSNNLVKLSPATFSRQKTARAHTPSFVTRPLTRPRQP